MIDRRDDFSRRKAIGLLIVVLATATVLRGAVFAGFGATDDASYARIAYEMSQGRFNYADHSHAPVFPLRIGLLAPGSASPTSYSQLAGCR